MAYDLGTMKVVDLYVRCDKRLYGDLPPAYHKRGMVLHATACPNVGGSSLDYLLAYHEPVSSSDQLIARDGTIYQLIPPGHFAYHSGPAEWEGYSDPPGGEDEGGLNMAFYGVEIENTNDGREPYTAAQYVSAAATYAYKCAVNRWPNDRQVVAHAWVALPYGRKTDPFRFNWAFFWKVVWDIRRDWPLAKFGGIPLWVPPGN